MCVLWYARTLSPAIPGSNSLSTFRCAGLEGRWIGSTSGLIRKGSISLSLCHWLQQERPRRSIARNNRSMFIHEEKRLSWFANRKTFCIMCLPLPPPPFPFETLKTVSFCCSFLFQGYVLSGRFFLSFWCKIHYSPRVTAAFGLQELKLWLTSCLGVEFSNLPGDFDGCTTIWSAMKISRPCNGAFIVFCMRSSCWNQRMEFFEAVRIFWWVKG